MLAYKISPILRESHIVLKAAQHGDMAAPYFLPWNEFWEKSPPEFGLWCSIRYYGMPLYPQQSTSQHPGSSSVLVRAI
jgi:hypothetical protein